MLSVLAWQPQLLIPNGFWIWNCWLDVSCALSEFLRNQQNLIGCSLYQRTLGVDYNCCLFFWFCNMLSTEEHALIMLL
jgi:hypothetical protein